VSLNVRNYTSSSVLNTDITGLKYSWFVFEPDAQLCIDYMADQKLDELCVGKYSGWAAGNCGSICGSCIGKIAIGRGHLWKLYW